MSDDKTKRAKEMIEARIREVIWPLYTELRAKGMTSGMFCAALIGIASGEAIIAGVPCAAVIDLVQRVFSAVGQPCGKLEGNEAIAAATAAHAAAQAGLLNASTMLSDLVEQSIPSLFVIEQLMLAPIVAAAKAEVTRRAPTSPVPVAGMAPSDKTN